MVRPKAGTEAGERATKKYRETMLKRYGSRENVIEHYKTIGTKGGKLSCNGGFASYLVGEDGLNGFQRARIAGAKGGRKSSRAGVRNGEGQRRRK